MLELNIELYLNGIKEVKEFLYFFCVAVLEALAVCMKDTLIFFVLKFMDLLSCVDLEFVSCFY